MRTILLCCVLAATGLISFRSFIHFTVTGKVTDTSGHPVPFASVREKGTNNQLSSNANGDFTISVKNEKAMLIFSSAGFDSKELRVSKETMTVVLSASMQTQQEVVITALKVQRNAATAGIPTFQSPGYFPAPTIAIAPGNHTDAEQSVHDWRYNNNYNTEDYDAIVENRFLSVTDHALSTFSIDVDAAAYSNVRRYLTMNQLPPAGSVRIEEMINYFSYDYSQPLNGEPFSVNTEMSACPWNPQHNLVLIGLQGKKIPAENLPASNLVFLIDVSGSMMPENRLPLVKSSMKLLVDQLREQDKVSIVVYAGSAGLVLPATSGNQKMKIKEAIDQLEAGGSTAGGEGIKLAYKIAGNNFLTRGNNRVILCTDGDFNVGVSSDAELERIIEEERKSGVFLTVLGYGMGNYKDNKMQKMADKGNGNHAYIDGISEARKVLVNEFGGTLFTIAKDVKLQIEFNPAEVQAYRLIGYENRMLNKEDFNNDKKDAGELGSGHTVTALYEVIPAGVINTFKESVDSLKYWLPNPGLTTVSRASNEIMTIKLRYKKPDGNVSRLLEHPVKNRKLQLANTSDNFRFAASVAEFGMLLRNSEFKQSSSFDNAWLLAKQALGKDEEGYRSEYLELIKSASILRRQQAQKKIPEVKIDFLVRP